MWTLGVLAVPFRTISRYSNTQSMGQHDRFVVKHPEGRAGKRVKPGRAGSVHLPAVLAALACGGALDVRNVKGKSRRVGKMA